MLDSSLEIVSLTWGRLRCLVKFLFALPSPCVEGKVVIDLWPVLDIYLSRLKFSKGEFYVDCILIFLPNGYLDVFPYS